MKEFLTQPIWPHLLRHPLPSLSTHSTPRSNPSTALRTSARGMLRVDTERRFLPRFKNRGLASSNVSTKQIAAGRLPSDRAQSLQVRGLQWNIDPSYPCIVDGNGILMEAGLDWAHPLLR